MPLIPRRNERTLTPDERGWAPPAPLRTGPDTTPPSPLHGSGPHTSTMGDLCGWCGEWIWWDTDGNGRVLNLNRDGSRHGCPARDPLPGERAPAAGGA
jgi:hypothetical protein